MNTKKKNIDGLLEYHKKRNLETIEKVNKAIIAFKKGNKKITISAIAKKAGVSVASIYNNPILKERIEQLKDIQKGTEDISSDHKKSIRNAKIDELKDIINKLRVELEQEKVKNSLLLGHLEKKTTENLELKSRITQYRTTLNIKGNGVL